MRDPTEIVVPCYNEERRLCENLWHAVCERTDANLLFVNDGSADSTKSVLRRLVQCLPKGRARFITLAKNRGKGEAVRHGFLNALENKAKWVGFVDADGSFTANDIARLLRAAAEDSAAVVLASRVRLLGCEIQSGSLLRKLFSRIFATYTSAALGLPVHDSQCGFKLFAVNPTLRAAIRYPFTSRWAFDVELIGRLTHPEAPVEKLTTKSFLEVPLRECKHVPGSKVSAFDSVRVFLEVARIGWCIRLKRGKCSDAPIQLVTPSEPEDTALQATAAYR